MTDTGTEAVADSSAAEAAPPAEAAPAEVPVETPALVPEVAPEPAATPSAEPAVEVESPVGEVTVPEVVPETEITEPEPPAQEPPASAPASSREPALPSESVSASVSVPVSSASMHIKDRLADAFAALAGRKRKRHDKIVQIAKEKGSVTNDDVQIAVHVSHATATRYLSQLVLQGRLRVIPPLEHARYEPS